MMIQVPFRLTVGAAFALVVVGCQRADDTAIAHPSSEPAQRIINNTPIPQASPHDPSVPDAATALAQDAANAPALATKDASRAQQAEPQSAMTKEVESKSMPLPSQANDHSTTALDKGSGK
jgi:hypothetical protein